MTKEDITVLHNIIFGWYCLSRKPEFEGADWKLVFDIGAQCCLSHSADEVRKQFTIAAKLLAWDVE